MPATRRLAWLAFASAGVLVLTHLLRIFTEWGQRWEDDAFLEAQALSADVQDACDALLSTLRIPTIAALVVAFLVIAAYRRQALTGLAIAFAFAGAVVSAEVLAILIPRPDLAAAYFLQPALGLLRLPVFVAGVLRGTDFWGRTEHTSRVAIADLVD